MGGPAVNRCMQGSGIKRGKEKRTGPKVQRCRRVRRPRFLGGTMKKISLPWLLLLIATLTLLLVNMYQSKVIEQQRQEIRQLFKKAFGGSFA
ncbi:Uncharacterised protein [uncultured archaeon]|nr:Uncharacterised protein [uncultured archaeon]